jgi:sugar phosphate isomerase/epimerase
VAEIAINLYSVRELDEPLTRTLDRVADAGYDGVQFSEEIDAGAEELAAKIDETGLDPVPAHVGIDRLEDDLSGTLPFYETLGIDGVVVPWLGPVEFETRSRVEETIDRLASLAERVEREDAEFLRDL